MPTHLIADGLLHGDSRSPATALVGRALELQALHEQWRAVNAGEPRVVLIEGPAGVGKTALIEAFLAAAASRTPLRVSGDESESAIALGLVDQLLRLGGAPPGVLRATGAGRAPVDHVRAGTLVLGLLDRAQAGGPTIAVVDDAHWVDAHSLAAILFAARRLALDRVLLVLAARDGDEDWLPDGIRRAAAAPGGCTLRLGALDVAQLGVLAQQLGVGLPMHGLRALLAHTGGNPLYARELLGELRPSEWLQGEPLPAPRSFAVSVERRAADCTEGFRALLAAAAVLGDGCPLELAAQLAGVGDPLGVLGEGAHAKLIAVVERHGRRAIRFLHPLVRAAVYGALRPLERVRLHIGAAALVTDQSATLRHRAAAAIGQDGGLADELQASARRSGAGGRWAAAAEDYRVASSLTPRRAEREERMLRALDAMVSAGQVERARRLVADAEGFADSALRDFVLANLAFLSARPHDAGPLFESAWRRCDPRTHPCLAVRIAQRHALHWLLRLEDDRAEQWGARALRLDGCAASGGPACEGPCDASALGEARGVRAVALAHLGRHEDAMATLAPALQHEDELGVAMRGWRGWLRLMLDDVDGARADLLPAGPAALRCGLLNLAAVSFTVLSVADYAAGSWDHALLHAQRAAAIVRDHEHAIPAFVWGAAIAVPAARGDRAACAAIAREAQSRVLHCADRTAWLGVVSALPAAAAGDEGAVLEALHPLTQITPRAGLDEPGFWPWQELYAHALVSAGRLAEADAFLCEHEAIATARARASAIAKLARVRGRLEAVRGERALAECAFERALEQGGRVKMPYELALTELAYGAFLRRGGRRRVAATLLQASRSSLAALGAAPALARCERELDACGLAPVKRRAGVVPGRLTPPERSVMRLVAAGLSNREVARELVVSVKTIEFHLTRIYSKLGVHSRLELAARVGADGAVARPAGEAHPGARPVTSEELLAGLRGDGGRRRRRRERA